MSLAAAAVLAAGVHGLHAVMVDRNADGLLASADAAEKKGEYAEAAKYVSQYLQFRPGDVDALERLAGLLRRTANSRQVWNRILVALENALRIDPSRDELRKTAVETAMKLRRYPDAMAHLAVLLEKPKYAHNRELMLAAARAQAGLNVKEAGDSTNQPSADPTARAVVRYLKVIDEFPEDVPAYAELAELIASRPHDLPLQSALGVEAPNRSGAVEPDRKVSVPEQKDEKPVSVFPTDRNGPSAVAVAERLLERMVERGKPPRTAYLARADYLRTHGRLEAAAEDLTRATQDPAAADDSSVLGAAASVELALGKAAAVAGKSADAAEHRNAARRLAEAGLTATPPEPRLNMLLAELALDVGNAEGRAAAYPSAERYLRDGLAQVAAARAAAEPSDVDGAEKLIESETQLRWSLTDVLLGKLDIAAAGEEKPARAAAEAELKSLREGGCRLDLVELLACRLMLHDHKWREAAKSLEQVRVSLAGLPDLRKKADLMLGACYARLNNPDRQVETFRRAVADDTLWVQGRMELAAALAAAGRTDEAIQEYGSVSGVPEAALAASRLLLLRELKKAEGDRDFSALEKILGAVGDGTPQAPGAAAVKAEMQFARHDAAAAAATLAAARNRWSDEISLWQAAIGLEAQRTDIAEAQRIARADDLIREAEAKFGDRIEIRLAKADVARLRGVETLRAEVARLAEGTDTFAPEQRLQLFEGLVKYAELASQPEQAVALWKKVIELQPDAIAAWLALATYAIDAGDEAGVKAALGSIRRLEGSGGPNGNFVEASWQVRQVAADATLRRRPADVAAALKVPGETLRAAADQRPYWTAPPRMLGTLETLAGNGDAAFEDYQRAFLLGDRSKETILGLVEAHRRKNRGELADAVLQQAERENPGVISGDLARIAWQVSLERGQVDTALDWAKRLAGESASFQDRLVQAHLLFAKYRALPGDERQGEAGKALLEKARAIYRKVVDDAPQQPEAWFAYIVHLWRIGEADAAKAAVEEAKQRLPEKPAATRLVSLAEYYEVVQMPGEAAKYFRQAVEADPADPRLRMAAADFFNRNGQSAEAETHLAYLLDPKSKAPDFAITWARRRQAFSMAARGRYEDVLRGLRMLRGDAENGQTAVDDLRAQLAMLSGRASLPARKDLIEILEQIRARTPLSAAERLQLASLYSQTSQWAKAQPVYEGLIKEDGANPVYLSEFLASALKNEKADERLAAKLRPRLDRLRAVEPDTIRTAVTVARFENRIGRSEAAAAALTGILDRAVADGGPGGKSVTAEERVEVRVAADAAEELELQPAAEALFRAASENAQRPEDALVLATYLGRRGRYAEGLDVCERYVGNALPEAIAVTAVNVVSLGAVPKEQLERADRLVTDAQMAVPRSARVRTAVAGLRSVQGRYDESEQLYRSVLAENPESVAALNNLAWLLAVTGRSLDEASRLIDEAIAIAGPLAALVDTRGVVDLARNEAQKATADLQTAFEDTPTANIGFHLALAYDRLRLVEKARESFEEARKLGLGVEVLHPTEHKVLQDLAARLAGRAASVAGTGERI